MVGNNAKLKSAGEMPSEAKQGMKLQLIIDQTKEKFKSRHAAIAKPGPATHNKHQHVAATKQHTTNPYNRQQWITTFHVSSAAIQLHSSTEMQVEIETRHLVA